MPQNIDFDTPSRRAPAPAPKVEVSSTSVPGAQSITPAADPEPRLRQPTNNPRSVNLNDEVPLDNTGDDETPTTTPPEQLSEDPPIEDDPADKKVEGEGEKEKEKEVSFEEDEDEIETHPQLEKVKSEEIPAGPRDYDSFPDKKLVPLLKKLPNGAYKTFEPILREVVSKAAETETLKKQLEERPKAPSYQYENPESYLLDPEYRKVEQTIQVGQSELNHWQTQLLRIENGEAWENITGFDQNGAPIVQVVPAPQDGKVDINAKLAIQNHLNTAIYPAVSQARMQLTNYKNNYQKAAQEAGGQLKQIVTKVFPTVPDVTKLEGEDKEWYEMAVNAFPVVFKDHPIINEVVGRMAVVMRRNKAALVKAKAEITRLKGENGDRRVAETSRIPTGGGTRKPGAGGKQILKYKDGRVIDPTEEIPLEDDDD